ncbi:carbonic anhydrase [Corynebacterium breve]|uniref:Carbonic anhydrase n=1 Tax=Corynebacterium breve TaxID=3049799 RepID=A0ABY8VCX9_9CORY|nr:carbonic anhydrase [Corynebacterium breve]WIM67348.1 carbonic anhydrase [Corynebacterium breve]
MPHNKTPQQIWDSLLEGNQRFVGHAVERPHSTPERLIELQGGQDPVAAVLSCSDSRAPVELIFDTGFGDLFVVRTAGESLAPAVFGSIEYAVKNLNIGLIVVLGHQNCGAVGAAIDALDNAQIPTDGQRILIEKIIPSVIVSRNKGGTTAEEVEAEHAAITADQLIKRTPVIAEKLFDGKLGVVAAHYGLENGMVKAVKKYGVE